MGDTPFGFDMFGNPQQQGSSQPRVGSPFDAGQFGGSMGSMGHEGSIGQGGMGYGGFTQPGGAPPFSPDASSPFMEESSPFEAFSPAFGGSQSMEGFGGSTTPPPPLSEERRTKRTRDQYEEAISPTASEGRSPFPGHMMVSPTPDPMSPMGGDIAQYYDIMKHQEQSRDASAAREASITEVDSGWQQRVREVVDVMHRIDSALSKFRTQLEEVRLAQKQMPVPAPRDVSHALHQRQQQMMSEVQATQVELRTIHYGVILAPQLLYELRRLVGELDVAMNLLQVFHGELEFMVGGAHHDGSSPCFARLLITKQPFPKVVKQHIKACCTFEDPLQVCLLVAPKADTQMQDAVLAEIQHEEYHQSKKGNELGVSNNRQGMDSEGVASFTDIKFPNGSRQKMVRVRFSVPAHYVQFSGSMGETRIESNPSRPFIVITNENQWEASAGSLLKKEIFEQNSQATWEHFANILQVHYLAASRQELGNPKRPLSKQDFEYIHHARFRNRPVINEREFEEFWAWFGKILHRIRHAKQFSSLWLNGFIYGFVSKQRSEQLLARETAGTFLIRFSEQKPGKVALAFAKQQESMPPSFTVLRHYLVNEQVPLPDFLHKKDNLTWMLRMCTEFCPQHSVASKEHKDAVIREFVPQVVPEDAADGYDLDCV